MAIYFYLAAIMHVKNRDSNTHSIALISVHFVGSFCWFTFLFAQKEAKSNSPTSSNVDKNLTSKCCTKIKSVLFLGNVI